MQRCWAHETFERPSFETVHRGLKNQMRPTGRTVVVDSDSDEECEL